MVVRSRLSETRAHLSYGSLCFRQSNDRSRPDTWTTTAALAVTLPPVAPSSGSSRNPFIRARYWWLRASTGWSTPCTVLSGHRRDTRGYGCRSCRCRTARGLLDRRGPTWKPGLPGAGCRRRSPANRRSHEELFTRPERAGNAIRNETVKTAKPFIEAGNAVFQQPHLGNFGSIRRKWDVSTFPGTGICMRLIAEGRAR